MGIRQLTHIEQEALSEALREYADAQRGNGDTYVMELAKLAMAMHVEVLSKEPMQLQLPGYPDAGHSIGKY